METIVRIQANVPWGIIQGKNGAWIGVCEPLKMTIQADTWASLMEDIGLTLNAVLRDLVTTDELSKFLRDQGWHLVGPVPNRPEDVHFDVPFFPAMMGADGPQRDVHQ